MRCVRACDALSIINTSHPPFSTHAKTTRPHTTQASEPSASASALQRLVNHWATPTPTPTTPTAFQQQQQQHGSSRDRLQAARPWQQQWPRSFSAAKGDGEDGGKPADADADPDAAAEAAAAGSSGSSSDGGSGGEGAAGPELSVEQLTAELQERERAVEELQAKVGELADSFKRSLAEMENLRQRTAREVDTVRKHAAEPLVKSLLDVADNLQRAAEAVPAAALDGAEPLDAERAAALLKSLLEGVRLTESALMGVFKRHGVRQFNPEGEAFDPNLHQAMFEVPAGAGKEAGTVAVVTKVSCARAGGGGWQGLDPDSAVSGASWVGSATATVRARGRFRGTVTRARAQTRDSRGRPKRDRDCPDTSLLIPLEQKISAAT